jgi:cell division protein FtsW (lipid II flippase)
MEREFEQKKQKSYALMRMTYDLTMAVLFLAMAVVMLFAEQLNLEQFISVDPLFRYMFGGICLLYGGFRLYRGIKRQY